MARKTDIKITQKQIEDLKALRVTPADLGIIHDTHKRNILYHLNKLKDPEIKAALKIHQHHNALKPAIKEKAMKMIAAGTGNNTEIATELGVSRSAIYTLRQLYLKEHGGEYKAKNCKPLKSSSVYKWFAVSPVPMRYIEATA